MPNTFGHLFRITTWGESHGPAIGAVIDGCPPNLPLSESDIQPQLNRRQPGQSDITTTRKEADTVEILSGTYQGKTTGAPISLLVRNTDQRPSAYAELADTFRPSHADQTYQLKYGHRDPRGGGRSSARETIARVAAGAIAQKILALAHNIKITAFVTQIHDIALPENALNGTPTLEQIDATPVRCPHPATAAAMIERIKQTRSNGDSLGGIITCHIQNTPPGLGDPVFDRLDADLAKAMLSIPATKAFDIGSGFNAPLFTGSRHNDPITPAGTSTNHSGGIQGGISNGNLIYFRTAFKPTPTIAKPQQTITTDGTPTTLAAKGRHDPCVLPRAVPIIESMAALVLLDHLLRQTALTQTLPKS